MNGTPSLPGRLSASVLAGRSTAIARTAFRSYGIVIALAVLIVVVEIQSQNSFLTSGNLFLLGGQWAPIGVMAAGEALVIIAGGFDLSVGTTYSFSATLAASMLQHHSVALAILAAMAVGAGIGLVNGFLVTKVNINPFIATLGTSQAFLGIALVYSNGGTYTTGDPTISTLGSGAIGTVPVPLIVMAVVMIVLGSILAWTAYGRRIYAVGGNYNASFLSGMRADRVRMSTYVISGMCAALAGLMYLGRIGSAQAASTGVEFQVIAAVLIGGISIAGGEGSMWRVFVGLTVLATLQNFFFRAGVNDFWQQVVQGVVILMAVGLDAYPKRAYKRPLRAIVGDWRLRTKVTPQAPARYGGG
jgi:ribose/xylose/arabinose/galactoside ABC-type transport system permease subunit